MMRVSRSCAAACRIYAPRRRRIRVEEFCFARGYAVSTSGTNLATPMRSRQTDSLVEPALRFRWIGSIIKTSRSGLIPIVEALYALPSDGAAKEATCSSI
jgi:hypothetical protein